MTIKSHCIQGRVTWWNPVQKNEDDFEEDEEEELRQAFKVNFDGYHLQWKCNLQNSSTCMYFSYLCRCLIEVALVTLEPQT